MSNIRLGVNIDHVATIRQARYRDRPQSPLAEPSPLQAALDAEAAGAHGITAHLRHDRRHIQDFDIEVLRTHINTKLNLEMGNTPEILDFALRIRPNDACIVPENRQEITTEGGLDCIRHFDSLAQSIRQLHEANIAVSLFIDPEPEQITAASALGAKIIELHTGAFANATGPTADLELDRLISAAHQAASLGIQVNAGHGLNYSNVPKITSLPHLAELNIGHSIISRAISVGMFRAVQEMLALLK